MDITLPYNFTPRDYQIPLWEAMFGGEYKRGITVWPRRNGKDLIYWNACIAKACQRVGLYFYIAPFYNQVRQIIWEGSDKSGRKFLDYIPRELVARKTNTDMKIELVNGSVIKLLGSDIIDRIVGSNPICIFFTEFSLHKPEAWHYLRPILAENDGEAWFNGTPRGLNHFYQLYNMAKRNEEWFNEFLTRDKTNVPTLEAIEADRRAGMPESLIQQEYYVKWTASSEDVLIPLDVVKPCCETKLTAEDFNFAPKIMAVDVAYAIKGDKASIAKRQGRFLHPIQYFQGLNNMALATRISEEIKTWHPDVVFVDAGRGEGVISRLWQLGYNDIVVPVHFSGRPYSDLYLNKRSEIYCKMRDWFISPNPPLIPYDEEFIGDITVITYYPNDKGFIQLEGKRELKRRLKRSPDGGDCVALTFAEDVEMNLDETINSQINNDMRDTIWRMLKQRMRQEVADSDYDVLGYMNKGDSWDM